MARHLRDLLIITLAATAIAAAATWPIVARFGDAGRLDSGDGRFSVWNVAWVAHTLTTDPGELWNANIFSPHDHALAYSEANLIAGVLAIPVWTATHNPYAAMNSVILISFALAALAMFALVRGLTGSFWGAAVAAVLYAFSPFAFAHIPQVQLLMTFGPPLALGALHRFTDAPSIGRAAALGVTLAVQGLACAYYGIYGGLAVGLGVVWIGIWSGQWRRPRYWALALLAAGIATMLVAPFFIPYAGIRTAGFERTLEEARLFRAGWRAYLASPLLVHQWILRLLPSWREVLFPGVLTIGLALVAVRRACRTEDPAPHAVKGSILGFYLVLAGLAMWGSFGPDAGLYRWLYQALPFMSWLRAPARLGLLVTMALVVVAGVGFAGLEQRSTSRRRRAVLITIVMCYAVARSSVGGLDLVAAPPVTTVSRWLGRLPRGNVAEFPYFSDSSDRHRHTEYMLTSIQHWQPLINGYSDYIPDDAFADMATLSTFPDRAAWRVLEARQARYLVIHWNLYEPAERARVRRELERVPILLGLVEEPDTSLFQLSWRPDVATLAER